MNRRAKRSRWVAIGLVAMTSSLPAAYVTKLQGFLIGGRLADCERLPLVPPSLEAIFLVPRYAWPADADCRDLSEPAGWCSRDCRVGQRCPRNSANAAERVARARIE